MTLDDFGSNFVHPQGDYYFSTKNSLGIFESAGTAAPLQRTAIPAQHNVFTYQCAYIYIYITICIQVYTNKKYINTSIC